MHSLLDRDQDKNKDERPSFPFIEFRIVNDVSIFVSLLFNKSFCVLHMNHLSIFNIIQDANNPKLSAIVDASVRCVVISYNQVDDNHDDNNSSNHFDKVPTRLKNYVHPMSSNDDDESNHPDHSEAIHNNKTDRIPIMKKHFTELDVEPSNSPFFSRVWYVRHPLDMDSPLLKPHIRQRISDEGKWPLEFDHYSHIRKALLPFRHIVSFWMHRIGTYIYIYPRILMTIMHPRDSHAYCTVTMIHLVLTHMFFYNLKRL